MVCIYFASVKLLNNVAVRHNYIVHFTSNATISGHSGSVARFISCGFLHSDRLDWIWTVYVLTLRSQLPNTSALWLCHMLSDLCSCHDHSSTYPITVSLHSQPVCWASPATNPSISLRNCAKLTQFMGQHFKISSVAKKTGPATICVCGNVCAHRSWIWLLSSPLPCCSQRSLHPEMTAQF